MWHQILTLAWMQEEDPSATQTSGRKHEGEGQLAIQYTHLFLYLVAKKPEMPMKMCPKQHCAVLSLILMIKGGFWRQSHFL